MAHSLASAAGCGLLLILSAVQVDGAVAQSHPPGAVIERVAGIGPYLGACIQRSLDGAVFSGQREATFSVSFRRDGTIFGEPRRTYSFPAADGLDQARFLRLTEKAIKDCAPLPFSKELGEAIAGRPQLFRYIFKPQKDMPA